MDPNHRNILKLYKERLNRGIDLQNILPHLQESRIFTKLMLDDITSSNADLFDELPTRGPFAFDKFISVLQKAGYLGQAGMLLQPHTSDPNSRHGKLVLPNSEISERDFNVEPQSNQSTLEVDLARSEGEPYMPTEDIYRMLSNPRGYCLIINNVDFKGLLDFRKGSDLDAKSLNSLFSKLNYTVQMENNLSAKDMNMIIKDFASKKEHKDVDSCVVVILSHGGLNDTIYGTDASKIKLDDILEYFDNINCKQLRGKPKMFFLQACRGKKYDSGVESADSGSIESADSSKIPSSTDMLIAYPTLPGHVAIRNHDFGSWFIKELVSVLLYHSHDTDLISMLHKVDREVEKRMTGRGDKQVTEQRLRGLRKKVYFNPGYVTNDSNNVL